MQLNLPAMSLGHATPPGQQQHSQYQIIDHVIRAQGTFMNEDNTMLVNPPARPTRSLGKQLFSAGFNPGV